jgi:hypothetical protein
MITEMLTALRQKQRQLEVAVARSAAAEAHASMLREELAFWREQGMQARRREPPLRQRVLELEAELADLRRQIDTLARRQAQVLVEQLVAALGRALEAGEAVMPGRVISQVETEFKGLLGVTEEGVGLRLYGAEAVSGEALSQVRLAVSAVPASLASHALPLVARSLEHLQAGLSDWPLENGGDSAEKLVAKLARLLTERATWSPAEVATRLDDLSARLQSLAEELPEGSARDRLAAAAANLAARLGQRTRPSPSGSDLNAVAAALQEVAATVDGLGRG